MLEYIIFNKAGHTTIHYRTKGLPERKIGFSKEIVSSYGGGVVESFIELQLKDQGGFVSVIPETFSVGSFGTAGMTFRLIESNSPDIGECFEIIKVTNT
jgi:hypothetical protein